MKKNKGDKHAEGIKNSVNSIIGTDTFLKRRKRSIEDFNREKFETLINTLEEIEIRAAIMINDINLDLTTYDEKFYTVIDILFELHFGKKGSELIMFYLYDRRNEDGTINPLLDLKGEIIPLNSPAELFHLLKNIDEIDMRK